LSKEEQDEELSKRFLDYVKDVEKEKLFYFIMASLNPQKVVIVKSPTKNAEMKQFLGYEWSSAKGNEGIKYLGGIPIDQVVESEDGDEEEGDVVLEEEDKRVISNIFNLSNINTPLYDPEVLDNPLKINYLISQNFKGETFEIPEELKSYVITSHLVDLLDFSRPDFNKAISTNPARAITISSKWQSKKIGDIENIEVKKGTSITQNDVTEGDVPVVAGGVSFSYYHNVANRQQNTITVSASGASAGYINYWEQPIFASDCTTLNSDNETFIIYIYNLLKSIQDEIFLLARGSAQPHVYPDDLKAIKVPLPPSDVQQKIVDACLAIDQEMQEAERNIKAHRESINKIQDNAYQAGYPMKSIDSVSLDIQYGINDKMNTDGNGYKIFRMNEIIDGYMNDDEMKFVDIPQTEFDKYKLEKGDILFNRTNSIEHVGKTGLFNLEGDYCFASYLIRIKVDKEKAVPEYVNYML
ncbi:restriction endonuclease subunit S, partial [Bacillus subtilis]|uniref:restriction endonuclease subunit S n=1 Tax=Bacillus subtilis TaxID=1423 RepID=UPI00227E2899